MPALDAVRRFYASEVCACAGVNDPPLMEAFARVHRESFLGPGPWSIAKMDGLGGQPYRLTPDSDPVHLYHNVAVAIDPSRQLNNGHPSSLASWLSALGVRRGDRVVHLGSGVGYYTAVLAELTGPDGTVRAFEVDPALAERARRNLSDRPWVDVANGDGREVGPYDAMFVNAGCTHPLVAWLDGLAPGGRLVIPLTARPGPGPHAGGFMVRLRRDLGRLAADVVSRVGIYDCEGARDPEINDALLAQGPTLSANPGSIRTFRTAPHDTGPACVVHTSRYCLSSEESA